MGGCRGGGCGGGCGRWRGGGRIAIEEPAGSPNNAERHRYGQGHSNRDVPETQDPVAFVDAGQGLARHLFAGRGDVAAGRGRRHDLPDRRRVMCRLGWGPDNGILGWWIGSTWWLAEGDGVRQFRTARSRRSRQAGPLAGVRRLSAGRPGASGIGLSLGRNAVLGLRGTTAVGDPTAGVVQDAAAFAAKHGLAFFESPIAKRTETLLGVQDTYP